MRWEARIYFVEMMHLLPLRSLEVSSRAKKEKIRDYLGDDLLNRSVCRRLLQWLRLIVLVTEDFFEFSHKL